MEIFLLGGLEVNNSQVSDWLKREDDPQYKGLNDRLFSSFLDGLIILKRGPADGAPANPDKSLNNNIILRKLRIAFNLKDTDMLEMLSLAGFRFGKAELNALFRKPGHDHYRECHDQVLRNFLTGMQLKFRPS